MNMLLHYLKFDLRRWRALIVLLWGLAAFYVVLMAGLGAVIAGEGGIPLLLEKMAWIVCGVMFGCFGVLCILAGGSDSVIRARTWLMTRPRCGRALFGARALIILGGAVLPVLLAWWGTLLMMKFNAATMAAEFPRMGLTILACAAGLALWSLVDPCIPGVVVGAAFTGIGAALLRLAPGLKWPEWFFRGEVTMLTLSVPVVVAALVGMRGLRTRLTRRSWALNGLSIGTAGVLALIAFIPLENWFRNRDEFDLEFAFRNVKEWRVTYNNPEPPYSRADSSTAYLNLTFLEPAEAKGVFSNGCRVRAFSWRGAADAGWSEWIDPLEGNSFSEDGQWHISFGVPWESAPELTQGELRFGIELTESVVEKVNIPSEGTALWRGAGWNLEALPLDTEGKVKLKYITRFTGREEAYASLDEEALRRLKLSPGGVHATYLRLPFVSAKFRSHAGLQITKSDRRFQVPANAVNLIAPPIPREMRRIVRVSNVTLRRPERPVPNKAPSRPERNDSPQTEPPVDSTQLLLRTPHPWTLEGPPPVPMKEATDAEAARWLQWVATPGRGPEGWVSVDQSLLSGMVRQRLPLFIELAVQRKFWIAPSIRKALADGMPEDRRGELLRRIPDAPFLAVIARDRGWLDEARPYILETLLRVAGVPRDWAEFIRGYRQPAFATRVEPVSDGGNLFRADLGALRTDEWQEGGGSGLRDPEELPRRLVPVLKKARGEHEPAFHLALQYSEFLYAGEATALEALLKHLREQRPDPGGWRAELLRQWTRQPDKNAPPADDAALRAFIGSSTVAGFRFDPAQHVWTSQSPTP